MRTYVCRVKEISRVGKVTEGENTKGITFLYNCYNEILMFEID